MRATKTTDSKLKKVTSVMRRRSGTAVSDGIAAAFGINGIKALFDLGVRGEAALLPALNAGRSVFVTTRRRTDTSLHSDLTDAYNSA